MASIKLQTFGASWCGPCRALDGTYTNIAAEYANVVDITHYDIDTPEGAAAYANHPFDGSVPKAVVTGHGRAELIQSPDANNLRQTLDAAIAAVTGIGTGLPNTTTTTTSTGTFAAFMQRHWLHLSLAAAVCLGIGYWAYKKAKS